MANQTATIHTHPALQLALSRKASRMIATRSKNGTQFAFWDANCQKWIVERINNDGQREQFAHRSLTGARKLATSLLQDCIA